MSIPSVLMTPATIQPDGQLHPWLRRALERRAGDPNVTADELVKLVTALCQKAADEAATAARVDELERVGSVTVDVDTNVWSTTDNGQLISFADRLNQLKRLLP